LYTFAQTYAIDGYLQVQTWQLRQGQETHHIQRMGRNELSLILLMVRTVSKSL
jgi:hypothetical protein